MFSGADLDSWAWGALGLAVLATFVWRFVGVLAAGRIQPDSAVFDWVSAVAYAMVSGLMVRIVLFPTGSIAETPLLDRAIGLIIAVAVWYWRGKSLFPGLCAGVGAFAILLLLRRHGIL
ncbi:MAG: AzlD domain-containing protein [Alphaproteobacteria bacterium]